MFSVRSRRRPSRDEGYSGPWRGVVAWPLVWLVCSAPRVMAQPPAPEPDRSSVAEEVPSSQRFVDPVLAGWWSGVPRWFMAGAIDAGWLYFRPRFSAGYGRPHALWVGVDVNPIFGGSGVGGYAGSARISPQHRPTNRWPLLFRLPPVVSRTRVEATIIWTYKFETVHPSRYLSVEAELTWNLPGGFRCDHR